MFTEMPLPSNNAAEVELLGALIRDNNKVLDVIDTLKAEDFYKDSHKHIYKAITTLYKHDKPIDIVTLSAQLKPILEGIGGVTYLAEIYSSSLNSNAKTYAEIIKELSNKRKLINGCYAAIEKAQEGKEKTKEIIENFENNILEIETEKSGLISIAEIMEKTITYIEENYNRGGGYIGMESGIKTIDNATDGFIKKDVVVIAGRPSMGKTLLAQAISQGLSKNNTVAFFELEMSDESLGIRQLANKTRINGVKLRRGDLNESEWHGIATASNIVSQNKLWIDTSSSQSIYDIKSKCKKLKLKHGLDCVIIDHIGLLEGNKNISQENRNLLIGDITRQAKIMAKQLDVNVILLSQLSRAVEQRQDKRPMMSDLRESGNIEQDADLVMFVYRDEYYNKETEDKNIMEVIISKQRNGKTGTLKLYCDLGRQTIMDLDYTNR